jgi:hypothetical protein
MKPNDTNRDVPAREEKEPAREVALDDTIEASFPASDPPSTVPDPDDRDALDRSHSTGRVGDAVE